MSVGGAGRHPRIRRVLRVGVTIAVACAAGLAAPGAPAATSFTWSGAGSVPNWSTGANWVGGNAPSGTAGTLAFPALPTACKICYQSSNDLTGLRADGISIDDGTGYAVSGNTFTLGAGGIVAAPSARDTAVVAYINAPFSLGAPQTWSITGGTSYQQLGIGGTVSGSAEPVAIKFGGTNPTFLDVQGNVEVGPATVGGSSGVLALGSVGHSASLNAGDGKTLTLSHSELAGFNGSVGPLSSVSGKIQVGQGVVPAGGFAVHGTARLDSTSSMLVFIDGAGTDAGMDYSQLTASGNVALAGSLSIVGQTGSGCPGLHKGAVDTLITTTGALTGTFTGIPNGAQVKLRCSPGAVPTATIHYTAHSVTATVTTAPPEAPSCNSVSTSTKAGTAVSIPLSCTENSNAKLTYAVVTKPRNGKLGSIDQTTGVVTYKPRTGFTGSDSFTYKATNAYGSSGTAGVFIGVGARAPTRSTRAPHAQVAGRTVLMVGG
jgi:large repetitive protein